MKASELLKYLPAPDANATGHGLDLVKVYRSYKNSPHNVDALYLKYLVHRMENGKKYHSASPEEQRAMDKSFLEHHQKGKAAEKNGHIQSEDLEKFIKNPDTIKLAKQLVNHKQKLNNFILKEHPEHIVDINGEPHLRLTRGLGVNREQRGEEHALASYADIPNPPFGGENPTHHHQHVPLKNIWFTYDYGPKEASSEKFGPENEFVVSPHKVIYNEDHQNDPTKQILVRNHHSFKTNNNLGFASVVNKLSLSDIDKIIEKAPLAAEYLSKHPLLNSSHIDKIVEKNPYAAAIYLNKHPLLNSSHINKIIEKEPYAALTYFKKHPLFNSSHIDKIVEKNPYAAAVHLNKHPLLNSSHINKIIEKEPYAAIEYLKDHKEFNSGHIDKIVENEPYTAAVHLNKHPLLNSSHINKIIEKEPEAAALHLKDHPYYIQKYGNMQKSFKQLTSEYERLKKSEEFKNLTPDDLLNKDVIKKFYEKHKDALPSEQETLKYNIENAIQKALLNTYHDPQYPEKLKAAWSKADTGGYEPHIMETGLSPRNWLTKTPDGKYDIDIKNLADAPLSFSALKHIKDMSTEDADKIINKVNQSQYLPDNKKSGILLNLSEFASLDALLDNAYGVGYNALQKKTKNFTEHPVSLDKLKEMYKRDYANDTSYAGKNMRDYVLSHPDTPKEEILDNIKNEAYVSPEVLTHGSLSPEDVKHAVKSRILNNKGLLSNHSLVGLSTKEKVDKGLAAIDGLHDYVKENPHIHSNVKNYGYHQMMIPQEDAKEYALNKLIERYNNKNYLSNDPSAAAAIRANLAHGINNLIDPDSPASQKALIEIAKGTHSIKDKTGKIKENDLLDNILSKRRFRTDQIQNFVNEVRRHVIESGHLPSVKNLYKQWGSADNLDIQKAELEHIINKFGIEKAAQIIPHMDAKFLRNHVFSNQELSQKIVPHLSSAAKAKLEKDGALGGISKEDAPLSFSSNTEMLRKLRDVADANGESVSAKQLGQYGLNENALKITHLKDAKGNYTKEAIQKHIDSLPKHTYDYSHTTWKGAQVHSSEKQYVFQLNHNEDLLKEMKNAGVYDTFAKVHEISFNSKHPVKNNTLGWVRYTKGKDGHIHIDEIQSDLGRSLHGSIKEYLDKQPDSPKKKKMEELFTKEKIDKMNDILFKGQHPSKIIHEGFLQFLRNNGNVGKDVHIWQAMPKAKLAGQDTMGGFDTRDLSDNINFHKKVEANKPIGDFDAGEVEQAARAFIGPHTSNELYKKHAVYSPGTATQGPEEISFNLEGYKNDVVGHPLYKLAINHIKAHATNDDLASAIEPLKEQENNFGRVNYPYTVNELPVHMKIGYQELPPKLDYTPDSYGKIQTQKTTSLKDQPTWKTNLRKSLKALTAEYERLTKADKPIVKLNPEHGKMIADAYHNMKHDPSHPEVKASYDALINETKQQYKDLLASGLKISKIQPNMDNPYPTSKHLHADMTNNNHMWYYPTSLGFGSEDSIPHDHPMLQETEFKDPEGKPMLANDVFRVVHDSVHNKLKNGFGPKGEHESFLEHKKTYSPLAQKALATETMGQNNYVNFSSQIGHLNRAKPGSAYAPQKAGLMSDEIINKDWHS
jgi:hypothetical protein